MLENLKYEVWKANRDLVKAGLVTLTWGNVSGINRSEGLIVIKPSGVDYDSMKPEDMVVVDLEGNITEGNKRPSSDTPSHIELYKSFPVVGGIAHTHSAFAVVFSQAMLPIPCYGTTHADHFYGTVPVTRMLTEREVELDYEKNTGRVIVETFKGLDPSAMPGVLVGGHAPFCWGQNAEDAVKNCIVLEKVAETAFKTLQLNAEAKTLPDYILKKHFQRKHGPKAYYGQKPE